VIAQDDETPPSQIVDKEYDELKKNKIGSDSYTERGAQTMNNSMKVKEPAFSLYDQAPKDVAIDVSNWDIHDTAQQEVIKPEKRMQMQY